MYVSHGDERSGWERAEDGKSECEYGGEAIYGSKFFVKEGSVGHEGLLDRVGHMNESPVIDVNVSISSIAFRDIRLFLSLP